jgi:hypothetical protein
MDAHVISEQKFSKLHVVLKQIYNFICQHKTNFMELSPSWEAANCAATQELPNILWNPKVHDRLLWSPPLAPILNRIDPVCTTPSYLRPISILSTRLRLEFLVFSSLLAFPPISHMDSSHSCCMPWTSHPRWLHHSNYTWWGVQVMKLLIMQFSPTSPHFPHIVSYLNSF